jgi:hypothetical protein
MKVGLDTNPLHIQPVKYSAGKGRIVFPALLHPDVDAVDKDITGQILPDPDVDVQAEELRERDEMQTRQRTSATETGVRAPITPVCLLASIFAKKWMLCVA